MCLHACARQTSIGQESKKALDNRIRKLPIIWPAMSKMAKRTRTGDLSHLTVEALEEGNNRPACYVKLPVPKVSAD